MSNPLPGMLGKTRCGNFAKLIDIDDKRKPYEVMLWKLLDGEHAGSLCTTYAPFDDVCKHCTEKESKYDIIKWWDSDIEPVNRPELEIGQIWKHECGTHFIVACINEMFEGFTNDRYCLLSLKDGDWYSDDTDPFDGYGDLFTYVGMAKDVLKI